MNRHFVTASMFAFPCALATGLIFQVVSAATPAKCFVISGGTVYDARTKLTWQQAPGHRDNPPVGADPDRFTSTEASDYCTSLNLNGGGWRIPRIRELLTIVDYTRSNPAIDPVAFPNTPYAASNDNFWTNSPHPYTGGLSYVNFASGFSSIASFMHGPWRVRCVR